MSDIEYGPHILTLQSETHLLVRSNNISLKVFKAANIHIFRKNSR